MWFYEINIKLSVGHCEQCDPEWKKGEQNTFSHGRLYFTLLRGSQESQAEQRLNVQWRKWRHRGRREEEVEPNKMEWMDGWDHQRHLVLAKEIEANVETKPSKLNDFKI